MGRAVWGQHLQDVLTVDTALVGALHPDTQVVGILSAAFTARNGREVQP